MDGCGTIWFPFAGPGVMNGSSGGVADAPCMDAKGPWAYPTALFTLAFSGGLVLCRARAMEREKNPTPDLPTPYLMASLRALPAVNFGTLEAAMFIFSLVWGLMPCRASRFWT